MSEQAKRLAVTMWDYSWLLRREGTEAEYADLPRILDELVERDYDCVRIDAFPHWVARDPDGERTSIVEALPHAEDWMWGNHSPVIVRDPATALVEFLTGLRQRGLTAELSSWFTKDSRGLGTRVDSPDQTHRVWDETLGILGDEGLLDVVIAVDLCNEWPGGDGGQPNWIFGNADWRQRPFTEQELERMGRSNDAVLSLSSKYGLPMAFSIGPRFHAEPLAADEQRIPTDGWGFVDVHLWMAGASPQFWDNVETGWLRTQRDDSNGLQRYAEVIREVYPVHREDYLSHLRDAMVDWQRWADARNLPLWTTEGWASVGWRDGLLPSTNWEYVRDVAEAAVGIALEHSWHAICTSNFSQPHHPGMWADAEWHRSQNRRIHAGTTQGSTAVTTPIGRNAR